MSGVETIQHIEQPTEPSVDSSTAQVWAVDTRTRRYVFMANGEADRYRDAAKDGDLACPVPDCPTPAFQAVGKTIKRRHHFRHVSGHKHPLETIDHVQAKAMLSEWARARAPEASVQEEMRLKEPLPIEGYMNRRADVGVAWLTGNRVALEVEYKIADPHAWTRKQSEYTAVSVVATWLIGHTSKHLRVHSESQVRIGNGAQTIAAAGLPLLTVNPYDRTVGTLLVEDDRGPASNGTGKYRLARPEDRLARVVTCTIDDCLLDPSRGLVTVMMDEIRGADEQRSRDAAATAGGVSGGSRQPRPAPPPTMPTMPTIERRRTQPEPEAVQALDYDERVALQPKPDLSNLNEIHCGQCAYRVMVGLPVKSAPTPPRYLPWRDWSGTLIAQPPPWAPGGKPLGQPR